MPDLIPRCIATDAFRFAVESNAPAISAGRRASQNAQASLTPSTASRPDTFVDMSTKDLPGLWARQTGRAVVGFYGHSAKNKLACFSNFSETHYRFRVPACCWREGYPEELREADVKWSEQAIMLCKALLMGDTAAATEVLKAKTPAKVKALGRTVTGWDEGKWHANVLTIGREAVVQKFVARKDIQGLLLDTGDAIICESTINDTVWGIGINTDDPAHQDIAQWKGTNILGWALMEARAVLRTNAAKQ
eukprot:Hpha_TRINITY_DN15042_c3_g4::TRINITY_DN15042_c3_g4_i1::g.125744::m.125744/K09935/K09935; uncharacterized protein